MAFENDTNKGRVAKIVATLDLLRNSAKSNEADAAAVTNMLKPVSGKLAEMGVAAVQAARNVQQDRKGAWGASAPQWASVHDMAISADLDDLGGAMIVYLERCADERAERQKS